MEKFISEYLGLIISFLLGLFSVSILEYWKKYRITKKRKEFIKSYLKGSILPDLHILTENYLKVENALKEDAETINLKVFEGFNTNVLDTISPVDYYDIFKDKYVILNEIIGILDYLSSNLPLEIYNMYSDKISSHRKEKARNPEHEYNCDAVLHFKKIASDLVDYRVREVELLKSKILEVIN